jgi:predicted MFS family arabinose efflux permease
MKVLSHRNLQLFLLAMVAWATMYCRSALGPLQEAVRSSLHLSDNQMGLIQGAAMAVPMAICSVPLGLLADRFSRARMLFWFVALMPVSCILSALVSQFPALLLTRCLAGVASAAFLVFGYSIIGDLYSAFERGRASMIVASAEIIGAPVAFTLGGTLLVRLPRIANRLGTPHLDGWREALLVMGALLIPIALFVLLLREPARGERELEEQPLRVVWPELWRYRAVALPILAARGMVWLADGAVFVWAAPGFSRRFHWAPDHIGAMMGLVLLVSGVLGPALGGPLADFCQRHGGPRCTVTVLAVIALTSVPVALFNVMPTANSVAVTMVLFLTLGFIISTAGVALSIIVIPGELRGVYLGATFTVGSIFFVGLAPVAVSGLSTLMGGGAMISRALAVVCAAGSLLGFIVFALSARFFPGEIPLPRSFLRSLIGSRQV